jgi:hypothetical protein
VRLEAGNKKSKKIQTIARQSFMLLARCRKTRPTRTRSVVT